MVPTPGSDDADMHPTGMYGRAPGEQQRALDRLAYLVDLPA
jgi:hypothetical protein